MVVVAALAPNVLDVGAFDEVELAVGSGAERAEGPMPGWGKPTGRVREGAAIPCDGLLGKEAKFPVFPIGMIGRARLLLLAVRGKGSAGNAIVDADVDVEPDRGFESCFTAPGINRVVEELWLGPSVEAFTRVGSGGATEVRRPILVSTFTVRNSALSDGTGSAG